jgi:putative ABC transport system substrate-binding protein
MRTRRRFTGILATASAWPLGVRGQLAGRGYRLGWIGLNAPSVESYNRAFVERLARLGFVVDRNLTIEFRDGRGGMVRLAEAVNELDRLHCDVVFAPGTELYLRAVEQGTRETPIVIVSNDYDPVATGHAHSIARPGGRVTGVSQLQTELPAKRLEVLKELLPRLRRLGVLADVSTTGQLEASRTAAVQLGLELVVHEFVRVPYDIAAAFDAFARGRAEAMLALASGFFVASRRPITEQALRHRLPSMFNNKVWTELGGLISYGPDFSVSYVRAAEMVAKILSGARPADMPIEQPSAVEMVLNLRTARASGIAVPASIRARVDRLID